MRMIVHIGLPKSASTTLQSMLDAQRDELLVQGTLVPRGGYRRDPGSPTGLTPGHDMIVLLSLAPARLRALIASMFDEAHAAGCQQIILSSENLTHPENLPDLEVVRDTLAAVCDSQGSALSFVLIDRSDENWLRSYHHELVLDGRTLESRTWESFKSEMTASGMTASAIRQACEDILGDRLHVSPAIEAGMTSVLEDFSRFSGVTLTHEDLPRLRASPSAETIEHARVRNAQTRSDPISFFGDRPKTAMRALVANSPAMVRSRLRRMVRTVLAITTPIR